jgi:hypothetical protein
VHAWTIRQLAAAGLALSSLALAAVPAAAAGSTPSPKPSASGGKTINVPANAVTFAIAPSNGKTNDGRPTFGYGAKPGEVIRDHVIVYNLGRVKATLVLYPIDAITGADGSFSLSQLTDQQKTFGRWAKFDKNFLVLQGGQSVVVGFTITVPKSANPGDVAGGIVVSDVPKRPTISSVQQQLAVATRVGLRSVVRVDGKLRASLAVNDLTSSFEANWKTPGYGRLTVSWTVTNDGNVRVGADQQVEVAGPIGGALASSDPGRLASLLPGDSVHQSAVYENVLAPVRLSTTVDAKPVVLEGEVLSQNDGVTSTSTWAVSWSGVAIITLIGALVTLFLLRLRRRRAAAGGTGGGRRSQPPVDGPPSQPAQTPVSSGLSS